jgi:alkylation response protein AidB-like acyl-CoA dehydrogenase
MVWSLLNQELDLMPTQEKRKRFIRRRKVLFDYRTKMWISNAGFCSLFIVFARIGDDKNITGFIIENDADNGISMGEEEHKLGIRASTSSIL